MSKEKDDKKYYKQRLQRARKQRYVGLKNAFNIVQAFAEPSLPPVLFEKYEQVKEYLLKQYK